MSGDASRPGFAVIIVAYNGEHALRRMLPAVLEQSVGRRAMEVCVVDNRGAGRPSWADGVDVWVDPGRNLGCSGGRNLGARSTSAPLLVFIDDDAVPEPGFVEALGEVMERSGEALAVRGKVIALDHPVLSSMCRSYDLGPREAEDMITLEGGCCIRRTAFEDVDGYDASRSYHEGLDLSARILAAHPEGRFLYTPRAVMRHDFVKGWRHMLEKARMLADADRRLASSDEPDLRRILDRLDRLRRAQGDGRSTWQKVTGTGLGLIFRSVRSWYGR